MTDPAGTSEQTVFPGRSWEDLLDFLDRERPGRRGAGRDAEAEARYREIVRKLVSFFAGRGCRDAEDMAAECVVRVAGKCASLDASARENPPGYFYGVARNVLHEWWRHELRDSRGRESLREELARAGFADGQSWRRTETVHQCLERCMGQLTQRARQVVPGYYGERGAAKVESHQRLAADLGKSLNALRIEVHRIRAALRRCVVACLQSEAGDALRQPADG